MNPGDEVLVSFCLWWLQVIQLTTQKTNIAAAKITSMKSAKRSSLSDWFMGLNILSGVWVHHLAPIWGDEESDDGDIQDKLVSVHVINLVQAFNSSTRGEFGRLSRCYHWFKAINVVVEIEPVNSGGFSLGGAIIFGPGELVSLAAG